MLKISVIIPVFNTEKYIEQCIQSLQQQTYTNIEIILINDGSNQICSNLLEELAQQDDRIVLLSHEENRGAGAARNLGMEHASGEYMYFMDSDDYIPEQTIEMLISEIKDFPMIRGRLSRTRFNKRQAIILDGVVDIKMYDDNKYNLTKHHTIVNFLMRTDFIEEHNLTFSEDIYIYSDMTFLIPALVHVEQLPYLNEALYFKRLRNDPIYNPSLKQQDEQIRILDFLRMYIELKSQATYMESYQELDQHLLNFYRAGIVTFFEDSRNIKDVFEPLSHALSLMDRKTLRDMKFVVKREVKAIIAGDLRKYKRINDSHQFLRALRKGMKSRRAFYYFLHNHVFSTLPLKKNQIFIESFLGKSYSDSPKYIYEYMQEHYPEYDFIWSFEDKKEIPGQSKQVKRFSLRYFYHLARSAHWISNARMPNQLEKRAESTFLQTWHGTPLKRLALDMDDVSMPGTNAERYKRNFARQTEKWDYLIAPNAYSSTIFKRAFAFRGEMLEYGYPRNDLLTKADQPLIDTIKKKLSIPLGKKVVLYAPTWRDDEYFERGKYKFSLKLDLEKMQQKFGEDHIVLLRTHYLIANALDISEYEGFVYDFSSYDDIAELYVASDILITDYSSVFFDYANLKRPILFFTYDLEKYRDQLRGFYIDMETELPGPLLDTSDEVLDAIERIDEVQAEYEEKYDAFHERFCSWDDGRAAQKTVEHVFGPPQGQ